MNGTAELVGTTRVEAGCGCAVYLRNAEKGYSWWEAAAPGRVIVASFSEVLPWGCQEHNEPAYTVPAELGGPDGCEYCGVQGCHWTHHSEAIAEVRRAKAAHAAECGPGCCY